MRYAVVDQATGLVVNVIELDPKNAVGPDAFAVAGCDLVGDAGGAAGAGDRYVDGAFVRPPVARRTIGDAVAVEIARSPALAGLVRFLADKFEMSVADLAAAIAIDATLPPKPGPEK